ncbi:MAG: late competence development ComFB family protein [Oscillospiraceae bacterium]|nr:late competence development ComFB family protein [Oscillospiraceae bacterium]
MGGYNGEYVLVNVTEQFARILLPDMIANAGGCTCEKCKLDVLALTLNCFGGSYVTLKSGEDAEEAAKMRITDSEHIEIMQALARSIDFVRSSPRH